MGYDERISRGDAKALELTQEFKDKIFANVTAKSQVLGLATRLPNMTSSTTRLAVLNLLPEAYFVADDGGLKQTTKAAWKNQYIYAEELAVLVPMSKNVLDDAGYDIWGQIEPAIEEAIYKKIDAAIISGAGRPATWREGLIPSIINAGNNVAYSADDNAFIKISKAMGKVEADGYEPNGLLGGVALKQAFREGLRDSTGQPLANSEVTELPRHFVTNGAWDDTVDFVVGDFSQLVYAFRNDLEIERFDTGVISDGSGNIVYNLLQQDMVCYRCVIRLGYALPIPANRVNGDATTVFPFALVQKSSAPTTYNVVFTVTDGSSDPVQDAYIDMAGQILKTNASGQATFKSLGGASYKYLVEKGAKHAEGSVTVASANTTVAVENF